MPYTVCYVLGVRQKSSTSARSIFYRSIALFHASTAERKNPIRNFQVTINQLQRKLTIKKEHQLNCKNSTLSEGESSAMAKHQ